MADWVRECARGGRSGLGGPGGQGGPSGPPAYPEIAANAVLVLLAVACALLDRQIAALAAAFENEGGFTERLYRVRTARRTATPSTKPAPPAPSTKSAPPAPSTKSTSSTKSTKGS